MNTFLKALLQENVIRDELPKSEEPTLKLLTSLIAREINQQF